MRLPNACAARVLNVAPNANQTNVIVAIQTDSL
jgi:hypothetical protein